MSKHTAGPWSLFDALTITAPQRGSVAFAYGPSMPEQSANGRESMANARLIAAAPELLQALQVIAADSRWLSGEPTLVMARAAIAKATGEQQ